MEGSDCRLKAFITSTFGRRNCEKNFKNSCT